MTDLDKLIEAVEGGVSLPMDGSSYRLFGDAWLHVFDACNGSLDAAKALHEALLPGWEWTRYHDGEIEVWATGVLSINWGISYDKDPARAWLIAILKAYRAQVQT